MDKPYLAHRREDTGEEQLLIDHLRGTAELAGEFGKYIHAEKQAYRCGLMHDGGKYSKEFAAYLHGAKVHVDHSTAGALEAKKRRDIAAAFAIAGHHAGLPNGGSRADKGGTLNGRLSAKPGIDIPDYREFLRQVEIPEVPIRTFLRTETLEAVFFTRMLYSCLVDADWLDTEKFMSGGTVHRESGVELSELQRRLDAYTDGWKNPKNDLNRRRSRILQAVTENAQAEKGLFTLSVPTGGGKTVTSMAFALRHALLWGQRRIIYIIPYTSILEQTADVFSRIFGAENVLTHYANVEFPCDEDGALTPEGQQKKLACENWDAPIILTTAVQFFESLFQNRSSACRKLHNIADSVLIFDEAQTLPVAYLRPCVWAVSQLVQHYDCTAVLCTATQPQLGPLLKEFYPGTVRELCPDQTENHAFFRRVTYVQEGLLPPEALADRLAEEEQTLCVVNSRKLAQKVFAMLPEEGRFHLSTAMTAMHRTAVLEEVRRRLIDGEPCRVVSTSLIEAGVDVDFPGVYRELAGLDSIIQAAGRCNREGKRTKEESLVRIFTTGEKNPVTLKQNIACAEEVLKNWPDPSDPQAVSAYFTDLLYHVKDPQKDLDQKKILTELAPQFAFANIAEAFHIIENDTVTVYIPVGEGAKLVEDLRRWGPSRERMRKLGLYSVSVYKPQFQKLEQQGVVRRIGPNAAILEDLRQYDAQMGLLMEYTGGEALFM